MTQAEQQIVPHARGKEMGERADITDPPTGNRQWHTANIRVADHESAARRCEKPGKELRHDISAAVPLAYYRHIRAERKVEIDPFEQGDAVIVPQTDIGRGDLAVQRLDLFRHFEEQAFVEHLRNLELLDDLLVFNRHVL